MVIGCETTCIPPATLDFVEPAILGIDWDPDANKSFYRHIGGGDWTGLPSVSVSGGHYSEADGPGCYTYAAWKDHWGACCVDGQCSDSVNKDDCTGIFVGPQARCQETDCTDYICCGFDDETAQYTSTGLCFALGNAVNEGVCATD